MFTTEFFFLSLCSNSFVSQENYLSPHNRPVDIPPEPAAKSFESIFEDTLLLSSEECYKLFYLRLVGILFVH